ncbi:MAG: Uma2 family endonuclease [Oscillatoriales cyanobacterium RU_3_3]|nr:Uma2 family endonuclease [Microcoleus sp. SU_5_3]NJL69661.1 Uma2 family endonuclease [Microcoleus sp. SM1_3_4]NJM63290.1 Uma2 family endonuclease [Oscillatoriales cyanobacterium RU_3_3]
MIYTPPQLLTCETFIEKYGDNPRYELIDGELRDMEPTGPHEAVAGSLAGRIYAEILRSHLNWLIPKNCLIKPPAAVATVLRPDVVVLDKDELRQEPLWQKEPVICNGSTIKLVIEVISTNWQDDYARKVEEYALLGIPEYWIADYKGLGGIQFIGKPKQPTFTVYQLAGDSYRLQQFRLGETIISPLLPRLQLKLDDVMP